MFNPARVTGDGLALILWTAHFLSASRSSPTCSRDTEISWSYQAGGTPYWTIPGRAWRTVRMQTMSGRSTGLLPDTVLRRVVSRVAEIPGFGDQYREFLRPGGALRLTDLPIITKDTFRDSFEKILRHGRDQPHGAFVYGSGGTTSAPKLSLIDTGMFISQIRPHWNPLTSDDVLVNFGTTARLYSSHNFFNMLAHESGAVTVPLGTVEESQLAEWLTFMARVEATAINSVPSHVGKLLEFCEANNIALPALRKVLWTGEAFTSDALEVTRRVLPEVELWGCYGSTETWVIGHNGPRCPVDVFHLLPYQHIEIVDGLALVTNTDPRCVNPILRYRTGDVGELVSCGCGFAGSAIRVLGRDDPHLNFLSVLVTPVEIADVAREVPGVLAVQLALFDHGGQGERMEVRVRMTPEGDADQVRTRILSRLYRLGNEVAKSPGSFTVVVVDQLTVNPRSNKTPLFISQ
jgi:phenylacetate-coenzyme A ligase PaaK-like adenylate-forming protein